MLFWLEDVDTSRAPVLEKVGANISSRWDIARSLLQTNGKSQKMNLHKSKGAGKEVRDADWQEQQWGVKKVVKRVEGLMIMSVSEGLNLHAEAPGTENKRII